MAISHLGQKARINVQTHSTLKKNNRNAPFLLSEIERKRSGSRAPSRINHIRHFDYIILTQIWAQSLARGKTGAAIYHLRASRLMYSAPLLHTAQMNK